MKTSRRALAPVEPDAIAFRLIYPTRKSGCDRALPLVAAQRADDGIVRGVHDGGQETRVGKPLGVQSLQPLPLPAEGGDGLFKSAPKVGRVEDSTRPTLKKAMARSPTRACR